MTLINKNLAVVAMSGGVDSSVAALLLKEQGMEVIGISMKMHSLASAKADARLSQGGDSALPLDHPPSVKKSCCTAEDINDARQVCQQLDIPFYALNFTEEFSEKVIRNFGEEYARGRTPNPCVQCNNHLKFSALLQEARKLGAYYLATGHYVQKNRDRNGRYHVLRARDRDKDQTYFLFGLGQGELEHVLFPVGKYTKDEVRTFARNAGMRTSDKPESQEICFVEDKNYPNFIENELPQYRRKPGLFVSPGGEVMGQHEGIHSYTVGQRRGLGVSAGERMYVTEINSEENQVVIGPKEGLLKNGLVATGVHWVCREMVSSGMEVDLRIRYRHQGFPATLSLLDEKTMRLDFKKPEGPITPGQAAVLYQGDELLGGGWIDRAL